MRRRQLAERRKALGLSQESLAHILGVDRTTVVRWECGETQPQPWQRPRLAKALKITIDELSELLLGPDYTSDPHGPSAAALSDEMDLSHRAAGAVPFDLMKRRTIVKFGASSAGMGMAFPGLIIELTRHSLALAVAESHAEAALEEWQQIVLDYGHSYMTTPADELLYLLTLDMHALQHAMTRYQDADVKDLSRIAAQLCVLTAMTFGNLGRLGEARRWWRTSRRMADRSADPDMAVWVRGYEIVRGLYEERPLSAVLQLADEANALTASVSAVPEMLAGKAQVLAMLNRHDEAESALHRLREAYGGLSNSMTGDDLSVLAWSETELRFVESFVYAYKGDVARAEEAQHAALGLYPPSNVRGPAQIELLRALSLVRGGDALAGVCHAHATMVNLDSAHHIRPVVGLGHKVFHAVSPADRQLPAARDFRSYLAGAQRPAIGR